MKEYIWIPIKEKYYNWEKYIWLPRDLVRDDIELFTEEYYNWEFTDDILKYYWEINEDIFKDEYQWKIYFGNFLWTIKDWQKTWCKICFWNFDCSWNNLTDLQWAPEVVGGNFDCSYNQLTDLQWAPEIVGGTFDCSHNQLTSLQWAPKEVWNDFDCSNNQLTDVKWWGPEVVYNYLVFHNNPAWQF